MLILTRKPGESLYIGDNVKITLVEIKGNQARLGIEADKSVKVYREEIYLQILEENKRAAEEAARASQSGLDELSDAWKGRGGKSPASSLASVDPGKKKGGDSSDTDRKKKIKKTDE